jgi:hypothetical protein
MEEHIFEILSESFKKNLIYGRPSTIRDASEKAVKQFKDFLKWKDDIKCEFSSCYNGEDKSRPKVCYERSGKHYTIDELFNYWENHK